MPRILTCVLLLLPFELLAISYNTLDFLIIVFQGEIGRRSGGDNVLEREGYAVSAGFSLGLVSLGMNCYSFHLLEFVNMLDFQSYLSFLSFPKVVEKILLVSWTNLSIDCSSISAVKIVIM